VNNIIKRNLYQKKSVFACGGKSITSSKIKKRKHSVFTLLTHENRTLFIENHVAWKDLSVAAAPQSQKFGRKFQPEKTGTIEEQTPGKIPTRYVTERSRKESRAKQGTTIFVVNALTHRLLRCRRGHRGRRLGRKG